MANIALYEAGTTDFFSQGMGVLSDVISSTSTETASTTGNESSKLELQYPVGGFLANKLTEGRFVRVSRSIDSSDYAIFEITDTLRDDSGVITVYGTPYSDRLGRMSFENGGKFKEYHSVQAALDAAKAQMKGFPSWFHLTSDLLQSVDFKKDQPYENFSKFLEALNAKVGGNVYYGLTNIRIYSKRGKDRTDIVLRDDLNTKAIKVKTDYSNIVNRIIPLLPVKDKKGNDTQETKVGKIVESGYANKFIDYWAGTVIQVKTQNEANTYFNRTKIDRPTQTVTVDPIELDIDLSDVRLFDQISVYSSKLDFTNKLRVSERTIDNLTGEVTAFKLGDTSPSIVASIVQSNQAIFNQIKEIGNSVISANSKNTNYHGTEEPANPVEGDLWYKEEEGETYLQIYQNGEWVDVVSTKTQDIIKKQVDDVLVSAKGYTAAAIEQNNASQQEVMNYIAKSQADLAIKDGDFINKAQGMADKALVDSKAYTATVASKSLGTYLVRLLPGTNIFKTANSTTIQAQVWKAGQDITSTLDNASFSWKIAKDGADAIGLTSNVKSVVAKPSDFNNTGTYIVNVIIPVTDINGTTRNQTFSDSTTIAKVTDGINGADGKNGTDGAQGPKGADGRTSYIHVAYANSADGTSGFSTTDATGKRYVGVYTDFTVADSNTPKVYTWSLIKGSDGRDGAQGIPGPKGADGISTYVHFAYANSSDGRTNFSVTDPTGRAYVGILTDYTVADSTDPTKYTWSLIKGLDGKNGVNGNGISSTTITYATSASGTIAPTSGYTSTIPTVNKGQFLWQRTTTSYTNGTTKNSDVVTYFAKDGLNGVDGMDGGQGMIAQPSKPKSGLVDGFLWLDTSQTYPVYYIYDSSIKDFKIYQFNAKNINADQIKAKFVGTDRLSASQIIADDLHVKSANIDGKITASQITVSSTNGTQTSLANFDLDGFNTTVTKVNNLAVGGTNLVSGTNQEYKMGFGIPKTTWQDGYAYLKLPTNIINGEILPQSPHTFFYTLVQGTTYTQTIWFDTDATVKDLSVAQITWYTSVEHDIQPAIIQKLGQNSYKIVSTYTWPGKTDNNLRLFDIEHLDSAFNLSTGTYLKFGKLKLEKGNIPTDWTPAPEDADNKISTVSHTVEGISSIVSDPTTGLTKRVQTAEGTLTQITGIDIPKLQKATFWQPYSSLNFNDYTEQGSFFFNTTSAKTNGPTSSTSWIYLIVEQGTADKIRIKQTAWYDGTNGVKITYVRTRNNSTWSPWYANDNDSVATISHTNESIKQEIKDRKDGDGNTLESSKEFTKSSITSYDNGIQSTITQTANGVLAKISNINLFPDSEFTTMKGFRKLDGDYSVNHNANIDGEYHGTINIKSTSANYLGYWANNIPVQSTQKYSGSVYVHFENNGLSNGVAMLDIWFVSKDGTRLSQGTGHTGRLTTSQVSSSYWVELYFDGVTPPKDAAYIQVSLLQNTAGAGMKSTFTKPMVTATEKHVPYVPNDDMATQLQLFKDNWSIGISDNIGKITSGIVGDTNSMSLISNNITLQGTTTVTGDFYAKGGYFKNLNASNITTGTINAAKIKVINLDVNSLSGNKSSFISGNIDKLNARVLYGTTGYLDTVSAGRVINNQDHHLQLAAHGMYNNKQHRAQLELLSYDDPAIDDGMKGSLNYYSEIGDDTHGIRFKANHILAIDTYKNGAGNLYLSAYARGEVRIVNREGDQYAPIAASRFRVASQRSLKSNITDLKDGALDAVNSVKIHKYIKSGVSEIGVITDEVPDLLKTDDGNTISLYDYTSVLYKAVQELSKQVKELQDERTNS